MKRTRSDSRERGELSEADDDPVDRVDVGATVTARMTKKVEKVVADKEKLKLRKVAEDDALDEGTRGDGVFYLTFLQMGQGDGAIMSTPQGKIVMIDCGTVSTDGENE